MFSALISQIYWFGDLNYRIIDLSPIQVKQLLDEKNYNQLLLYDQLKIQCDLKKVFLNYQEGAINHPPTYKYDPGTDNWDSSEKNRCPAWCDRVLWKGSSIQLVTYQSNPKLKLSDHKPVSALFNSSIKVINATKHRKIYVEVLKKLDRLENEFSPQVSVDKTELNFGVVTFRKPISKYLTIANTGQVPVRFEFIVKPNHVSYCKEWLRIKPFTSTIKPGDKFDVELEMYVDIPSVCNLNSGLEWLEDILILHLDRGKDLFITVTGDYKPSCFGASIDSLIRLQSHVTDMGVEEFQKLQRKENLDIYPICWGIPKEIWLLIDQLFKYGLVQEDLFQQPGLHSEFQIIKDSLDSGYIDKFTGSIHSIAEALLIFLESLSEPLVPYSFYQRAIESYHSFILSKQVRLRQMNIIV